jgi:transcriptional repressor NF-X1
MDPEPHRHVAIFKTPRFVSSPMKTLSQCIKIRLVAEPVVTARTTELKKPFNALILTNPRFALTIEELRIDLQSNLATAPDVSFNIDFLPSEEIVLYASAPMELPEATLQKLKPLIAKSITTKSLAVSVSLCHVDTSLNVIRREEDASSAGNGGWSQVVKGAPAKVSTIGQGVGTKSAFTVLGGRTVFGKKRNKEAEGVEGSAGTSASAPIVEDWEKDVDGWE